MESSHNLMGLNVAIFRRRRGWTRQELTAKLKLLGCHITLRNLADIEIQLCVVTSIHIAFFSQVFGVSVEELFPSSPDID